MDETMVIDFTGTEEATGAAAQPMDAHPDDLMVAWAERDAAIRRLREALVASEPGLDPALVTGETVEELEASLISARQLLESVRESVRREAAAEVRVGSPGRATAMPVTPYEKIRSGLGRLA
ncbi:MAG: hypothetical protein ACKVT1_08415 [Dehalococcoidia bacterium]